MTQGPERNRLEALLEKGTYADLDWRMLAGAAITALPGLLEIVALQEGALEATVAHHEWRRRIEGSDSTWSPTILKVHAALKAVQDAGLEKRP